MSLSPHHADVLMDIAKRSIRHGLDQNNALVVDSTAHESALQVEQSSFVTLHKHGELRGCVGSLVATQPLVRDVSHHAFAAGFKDPRFPPVVANELESLHVHISVLSTPWPTTRYRRRP